MGLQANSGNIEITLITVTGCVGCQIQNKLISEFISKCCNSINVTYKKIDFSLYKELNPEFKCNDFPVTLFAIDNKHSRAEGTISIDKLLMEAKGGV